MFVAVASGGLIVTAQFASIAADFHVAKSHVVLMGLVGTVLSVALVVDNVLNGLARPFFGWMSDRSAGKRPCSSPSCWTRWRSGAWRNMAMTR